MKRLSIILILAVFALTLWGQANGDLQYIGENAILHVWGSHYERGHAQGYLIGNEVMEVFDDYFWTMAVFSNETFYNMLHTFYQEHFEIDARMHSEAQGIIAGMQDAGISTYHDGLQRDLDENDILLTNAIVDLIAMRGAPWGKDLEIGCSSLSSWGVATQQDSLLEGSSVLTRFMDWSQNSALIANPLLVVHHPSETDEQKWLGFSIPGLIGALTAINEEKTWASLNMGNDHAYTNTMDLSPVMFDLRRGIERADQNADGASNALDLVSTLSAGLHLSGTIIHTMSENASGTIHVVVETNNSGTQTRYQDQNGDLPPDHLAATNHFRVLGNPVCCDRYANIQDSLNMDANMTAKRQWSLLSGAAGQETNLIAAQYVPSTGNILWSAATLALPAYQVPAITLSATDLFDFSVAVQEEHVPQASFSLYPNPLGAGETLGLKSSQPFTACAVYDLRGRRVFSWQNSKAGTQAALDLPELPNGIYLVQLATPAGKTRQGKFVICR